METEDPIKLTIADAVAVLRLNRPAVLNAINPAMAEGLLAHVREIAARNDVRAILLAGEGRAFCAGGDISRFQDSDPAAVIGAIIQPVHEALHLLSTLPQPSIAAVNGAAAGAGFSLALSCDLAMAADNAKFTLAYSRIGASPDGSSSYHLPRMVGLRKAKEIALLADTIDAAEAQRLGLVNRVVPAADLEAEAMRLALRLAAGPTLAYGRTRALLEASLHRDLKGQLEAEHVAFLEGTRTADFREGAAAFLGKRQPQFQGK